MKPVKVAIMGFKEYQPDRYLCFFFKGEKIIVTNAFVILKSV